MAGKEYTITLLLRNESELLNKEVTTKGKIDDLNEQLSKNGNRYVSYYLTDGLNRIRATDFHPNGLNLQVGDYILVEGVLESYNNIPYLKVNTLGKLEEDPQLDKEFEPRHTSIGDVLDQCERENPEKYLIKTAANYVRVSGVVTMKSWKTAKNGNKYIEYSLEDNGVTMVLRDFSIVNEVEHGDKVSVDGFVQVLAGLPSILIETIQSEEQDYVATDDDFAIQKEEDLESIEVDGQEQVAVNDLELGVVDGEVSFLDKDQIDEKAPFQVVINEDLLKKIEILEEKDKKRLDKALYNVQYKHWEFGVVVKKLAGISEPIFEARLDRSRRILFQIKSVPIANSSVTKPTIIIHDLVRHKKISDGANKIAKTRIERLNLQSYNVNLIGKAIEEETVTDVKDVSIDGHPLDELFKASEVADEDSTGLPNGIKYFRFDDEIRKEWIDHGIPRKVLALSPRQQNLVFTRGPLMINGGAGTGKTTVLTHIYSFKSLQQKEKGLYITLTRPLKSFIEEILRTMVTREEEAILGRVMTFNDVCRKILGSDEKQFPQDKEINLLDFIRWITKFPLYRKMDPLKLWQEYYGIIRGDCKDYKKGVISRKEYLEKGNKISLFEVEYRDDVYEIVTRYHDEMRKKGYWDSVDLAQFTLDRLEQRNEDDRPIEAIVCDEVQDFVEVQYAVFTRLVRPDKLYNLFFGGDVLQSINSSNFRWEDLRSFIHRYYNGLGKAYQIKKVEYMNRNFRSTSKMIDIANRFIEFKQEMGIKDSYDQLQSAADSMDAKHAPGMLINQTDEELRETFEELKDKGEDRILIVYRDESKEILKKYFKETYIFTVAEAKGLEFISTFLYNLATDSGVDWNKFFGSMSEDYIRENHLLVKYAFNRIYVALTRARRHLIVYESDNNAFKLWDGLKSASFKLTPLSIMKRYWTEDQSPEELLSSAMYFKTNMRYGTAADYFQRLNKTREATECLALDAREHREHEKAAELFLKIEMKAEAAKEMEHFNLVQAEGLYRELNDKIGIGRCRARREEERGNRRKAAELFENIKEYSEAVRLYKILNDKTNVAKNQALLHEEYKEWKKAAESWSKIGETFRANSALVKYYLEKGDHRNAATYAEKTEDWTLAQSLWQQEEDQARAGYCYAKSLVVEEKYDEADLEFRNLGEWDERISMWEAVGDMHRLADVYLERSGEDTTYLADAARIWVDLGDIEKALEHVENINNFDLRLNIFESANMFSKAAELCESKGRHLQAADMWIKANEKPRALECYRKSGERTAEADLLKELEQWNEAGLVYEELGEWELALEMYSKSSNQEKLALCYTKLGRWGDAGQAYESLDMTSDALEAYIKGRVWAKAGFLAEKMENYGTAAEYYLKASEQSNREANLKNAGALFLKSGNKEKAAEAYAKGRDFDTAAKIWEELNDYASLAKHYKIENKLKLAAENYEKDGDIKQAAQLYFESKTYDEAIRLYTSLDMMHDVAKVYRSMGNYAEAAGIYENLEEWSMAAEEYKRAELKLQDQIDSKDEEINRYKQDGKLTLDEKNELISKVKAEISPIKKEREKLAKKLIKCYEMDKNYLDAAEKAEREEMYERAVGYYRKVNRLRKAASINERVKNFKEAAKDWEGLEEWSKAAENFAKAGSNTKAAEMYYKAKDWNKSLKYWKREGRLNKIAECYEKLDKLEEAAKAWEESAALSGNMKEWRYAGKNYEKLQLKADAIRCYEKSGDNELIDDLLEDEEALKRQLDRAEKSGNRKKMAEIYEKLGEFDTAKDLWMDMGNKVKAAKCLEKLEQWEEAESLIEDNRHELAKHYVRRKYWVKAAKTFEEIKDFEKAVLYYEKAGMMEEMRRVKKFIRPKKKSKKKSKKKKRGV